MTNPYSQYTETVRFAMSIISIMFVCAEVEPSGA